MRLPRSDTCTTVYHSILSASDIGCKIMDRQDPQSSGSVSVIQPARVSDATRTWRRRAHRVRGRITLYLLPLWCVIHRHSQVSARDGLRKAAFRFT